MKLWGNKWTPKWLEGLGRITLLAKESVASLLALMVAVTIGRHSADAAAAAPPAGPAWAWNLPVYETALDLAAPHGTFREFKQRFAALQDLGLGIIWFLPIFPISGNTKSRASNKPAPARARNARNLATRMASGLLGALTCFTIPACKQASDVTPPAQQAQKSSPNSTAHAKGEDALVRQAASSYLQRVQQAASEHVANAKRMQHAKVLEMGEVTQREQLEPKREVVRKFLASNESLKSLLVNEETVFKEELVKLNVPPARIKSELNSFQSGIRDKTSSLRIRETEQRIGDSLLSALDFLDEMWGQWNYNKEYSQVQFSPPGALSKYNEFMEAIEAASREQKELQGQ